MAQHSSWGHRLLILLMLCIAVTISWTNQALSATTTGVGKDDNTIIVTIDPSELNLIEAPRLLIFEEKESGRLFRGAVLRTGGTRAVISLGFPPSEIGEGKTLYVYPAFKNDVYSPQMLTPAHHYQRRRSSLGLSGGLLGRRFAPQGESSTEYSGYTFSADPEYARPTGLVIGAHLRMDNLKSSNSASTFPSGLGLLAAEPFVTADFNNWFAIGGGYRFWSIRHSVSSAETTTLYDYAMAMYSLSAIVHGFGGEMGVGYETGAKVLPKTTSTAQSSSVKNTGRFLIQPPRVLATGRWSLGGGLFGSLSIGRILADESLYEQSDLIRNTSSFDRTIWRIGTEILTAGGTKWEFVARHDDPLTLREGGQPLYTGSYGGTLATTIRLARFLDSTISVDGTYGSKLYAYEGIAEAQSFEATQYSARLGMTWILMSRD